MKSKPKMLHNTKKPAVFYRDLLSNGVIKTAKTNHKLAPHFFWLCALKTGK